MTVSQDTYVSRTLALVNWLYGLLILPESLDQLVDFG